MDERHWPFTTPESKRRFAEVFDEDFMPGHREAWLALADLQEQGRLEEYHEARAAWQAQEPKPQDFV